MRKVINNLNGLLSKIYVGCLIWWGKVGCFFAFALFCLILMIVLLDGGAKNGSTPRMDNTYKIAKLFGHVEKKL